MCPLRRQSNQVGKLGRDVLHGVEGSVSTGLLKQKETMNTGSEG